MVYLIYCLTGEMPGDFPDNSTIGEKSLADNIPATTSIKSLHSAGDFGISPGDTWLQSADFYHGYLPREDIPPLLLKNGDFLVRLSEANVKATKNRVKVRTTSRVISVLVDPQSNNELIPLEKRIALIKNIVIMNKNKKWWIDPDNQFETLALLFESYMTKPLHVEKVRLHDKREISNSFVKLDLVI
ncbi:SH2 domain protein [Dictyocaulus viviparus]|uniref:SH2 domain protein n=1 Tax=Dictyocaulus viviparus TaxID=29172 RepID=A0A0D8Y9L5_DICVI|nr:SH2 domain protein [Dictyocaulus viviparus]